MPKLDGGGLNPNTWTNARATYLDHINFDLRKIQGTGLFSNYFFFRASGYSTHGNSIDNTGATMTSDSLGKTYVKFPAAANLSSRYFSVPNDGISYFKFRAKQTDNTGSLYVELRDDTGNRFIRVSLNADAANKIQLITQDAGGTNTENETTEVSNVYATYLVKCDFDTPRIDVWRDGVKIFDNITSNIPTEALWIRVIQNTTNTGFLEWLTCWIDSTTNGPDFEVV